MLEGILVDLVPHTRAYDDLQRVWNNGEAKFWSSGGERVFETKSMHERWRAERQASGAPDPSGGVWFGMQTKTGQPIGTIGIHFIAQPHRLAMLGAKIGIPAYWGSGYGTDALLLVLDYAFDWLDLRRVWLMTTSMNARVMRQMQKVGFTLEARQRRAALADGVWWDWLTYGLLREEYAGRVELIERLGLVARVAQHATEG